MKHIHTNRNSVELMINVEAFNAFFTETQWFPVAWIVLTTS